MAASAVPELLTLHGVPGGSVVVEPTMTLAAAPGVPARPCAMPKFKIAEEVFPELLTVHELPGGRVVVVPTVTVAAGPRASVKSRMAAFCVPTFVTAH
jgi:hypothetical protein